MQKDDLSMHPSGRILSEKMVVQGYFLKKWKLCLQNLTKGQKQPPVVILQQVVFTIYLSSACG